MYFDHLENWLNFGHRLLIFLILAAYWTSETVWKDWAEICHVHVYLVISPEIKIRQILAHEKYPVPERGYPSLLCSQIFYLAFDLGLGTPIVSSIDAAHFYQECYWSCMTEIIFPVFPGKCRVMDMVLGLQSPSTVYDCMYNKANLRDLIAATGLVILLKLDSNRRLISPCDLEIWWMTSKNNKAPLLYYTKLCASFQINRWIQTGVTVQKRSVRVKIGNFLSRVTLKFDGRPWKTNVQYFKAIGIIKLELQSGNAQFGSKLAILLSHVTFKIDGRPWKTKGYLIYTTSSFVHHFKSTSEVKLELLYGNAQFGSKLAIFCPAWPWNLMDALEKQ